MELKNTLLKLTIILLHITLTSCAATYYTPVKETSIASVSFSSVSLELPEIRVVDNCNSLPINKNLIVHKDPEDKSGVKLTIPATREITFEYNYHWFSGEKTEFITKGKIVGAHVEIEKSKVISSCFNSITFIPGENKHYEVSFEFNAGKCIIKASEGIYIDGYSKYRLQKVDIVDKPQC